MVLESIMICFDNSEYQRNGDYVPTRLEVQKDTVNLICLAKKRANPENNVGLLTMSNQTNLLATLTSDMGHIYTKMHTVQPKGDINFDTAIRIAHLALKHRPNKNHKMRIVAFVGSPLSGTVANLQQLGKRLKKENVNVDVVSYGNHEKNNELLGAFVETVSGKEGKSSHLLIVPRGSAIQDAVLASPLIRGDDGAGGAGLTSSGGYEFGFDPDEDPELAMVLRISMEEERRRFEQDIGGSSAGAAVPFNPTGAPVAPHAMGSAAEMEEDDEAMLARALAMSVEDDHIDVPDFRNMTEEQQIAYAMSLSLAPENTPMDQDENDDSADAPDSSKEKSQNKSDRKNQ